MIIFIHRRAEPAAIEDVLDDSGLEGGGEGSIGIHCGEDGGVGGGGIFDFGVSGGGVGVEDEGLPGGGRPCRPVGEGGTLSAVRVAAGEEVL